jgi:LEA14-like dessication related protein
MRRRLLRGIIALMLLVGSGCATLGPDYETPAVNVSSIRALPSESIVPRFEIGLHIVNPNRSALALQGIAYTLKLEGHKLLTGVANDLPTIEGYGEGEVTLVASTNLLGSIRLFTELMNANPDTITYDLEAKLDPGGIQPAIMVVESGEISLSGLPR